MAFVKSAEAKALIPVVSSSSIVLLQTSTYDESAILAKIASLSAAEDLQRIAIQLAVVGWTKAALGKYTNSKGVECEILPTLVANGVSVTTESRAVFKPDELTVGRLVRVFRHHISSYMLESKEKSFLLRKYGDGNYAKPWLIFPFSEHLVEQADEVACLIDCYQNMDDILGSSFTDRLKRVMAARDLGH
jgi:hypothetical protein